VSPFCALGLVPQSPSNFWMADRTHHSHNLFFNFPHGGCTNGHQLLLFIDLQSIATCPNEMYLLFRQGILPLVQSIMHSGRFTSHCLFARGTQLECSMGLLYQLIGVHRGGGFQSPSCALFSFPPKFGLIFTSCQLLHLLTALSPTTQLLTAHTVSTLVLLLYLYFFYLDFAGHSRLDSLSPNPDGYKKCIAVQLRVIYDSQMTNRKKLKNIFTSGRFESYLFKVLEVIYAPRHPD
jgi:hypothetical protein